MRRSGIGRWGLGAGRSFSLRPVFVLLCVLSPFVLGGCGGDDESPPQPYSFAFLGCNRVAQGDITPADPSTANLPQLERSFDEIAATRPAPEVVFFTGDLVYGLDPDLSVLRSQLEAWVRVYRASALGRNPRIRLVALPGNHESLQGSGSDETSNPGAEQVWLDVMSPFIAGDNGPGRGGPDQLETDQSRLTYSFDLHDTHFVVLNTDPFGAPATVPLYWIAGDVGAARQNASVRHIIALGHKPAFTPPIAHESDSLDTYPEMRDVFWDLLNGADAAAYLVAHAHVYYRSQPSSTTEPSVVGTWQVVAGNAGSPVDSDWAASGAVPFYGYSIVTVTPGGALELKTYGRNFDQADYLAPSPPEQYPTTVRDQATL